MLPIRVLFLLCVFGIFGGMAHPYQNEEVSEDPEWMWFPDGDGKLHLIHLREDKAEPGPRFSANQHVHFRLFTRRNSNKSQLLKIDDIISIKSSNFNAATETFFICHGWSNHAESPINVLLRNAYLSAGDYNVIIVDWATGASANYFSARGHAKTTGHYIGKFITFLVKQSKLSLERVHLVGHSLGAHSVGFAGKTIQNGKVNTIIGLDPASPLYQGWKQNERIHSTDGEYVEIIHTNGGKLGFWQPLGDADFYPNFGSKQPGCGLDLTGSCSHSRSYLYLAESITKTQMFRARRCRDINQVKKMECSVEKTVHFMGGNHNKSRAHGVFILNTASESPFGLG